MGARDGPGSPNSFNFMQFLGKFRKIICLHLHLGEILDPPLKTMGPVLNLCSESRTYGPFTPILSK